MSSLIGIQAITAYKKIKNRHPVFAACMNGDVNVVQQFLDKGGNVHSASTAEPGLALCACNHNQTGVLKVLLDNGLDPDFDGPIFRAIKSNSLDCAIMLLDHNANPNQFDEYHPGFFTGLNTKSILFCEKMIAAGADPQLKGEMNRWSALHWAAMLGDVDILEFVYRTGGDNANLDYQEVGGETALLRALRSGKPEAAKWLLDKGAGTDFKSMGRKMAEIAEMKGFTELVPLLS